MTTMFAYIVLVMMVPVINDWIMSEDEQPVEDDT